jgi:5-methylcytosine-specific restriction enzyme B
MPEETAPNFDQKQISPRPALADPFNEMFASWDEAIWAFDWLTEAANRLGLKVPDDRMGSWTLRRATGQYHLHFCYGSWLVLCLAGTDRHLTLAPALLVDRVNLPDSAGDTCFKQNEDEPRVGQRRLEVQTLRPLENTLREVYRETLDYIKKRFADWEASPYHKYTDHQVAEAVFNAEARARLLSGGTLPPPEAAFSPRAFELLEGIHDDPTKAYYQAHKAEFRKELEEPFQRVFRKVAERLPPQVRVIMETQKHLFSVFPKNDYGRGGAWDFYWGAFYPRGGKRVEDAQLSMWMNYQRLEYGFYIGAYGSEQRQRFQRNCQESGLLLAPRLREILPESRVCFGSPDNFDVTADGKVVAKTSYNWETFLREPAQADNDVSVIIPRDELVQIAEDALVTQIAETYERLFPLVLLSVEDDPMPAVGRYFEQLGATPGTGDSEHTEPYDKERFLSTTYLEPGALTDLLEMLTDPGKHQIILYGPPGTGKTYVARELARLLTGLAEPAPDRMEIVQFHPAYSYEDFIEGIRPESKAGPDGRFVVDYPARAGIFQQFCRQAESIAGPCVFIIDEINRGNIPRIFGELMLLLEYRGLDVTLAYSGKRFRIPDNVYLIGTMNTADRSIALVDFALRRRFHFFKCKADPELLKRWLACNPVQVPYLAELYERLATDAIEDLDFAIGSSHFMRPNLDEDGLRRIWKRSIEPYLEEYYVDRRERNKAERWAWDGELIRGIRQGHLDG